MYTFIIKGEIWVNMLGESYCTCGNDFSFVRYDSIKYKSKITKAIEAIFID